MDRDRVHDEQAVEIRRMTMNLIDAYVSEVGRRLPQKVRADIEAEIRSALQDLLDERSRKTGRPVDDEMTLTVLKEYGDPEKVAASYQGERYLIGPRLYPTFEKVVFAVLPITIVLALLGLGFSLAGLHATPDDVFKIIFTTIGNLIWSVITTIGGLAFIFAILERTVPDLGTKARNEKEWDPHSLFKVTPPDRIKTGDLIVELVFTALALVIFNFFPQLINIGYQGNGSWWVGFLSTTTEQSWSTTILSPTFFRYLPFLDIIWVTTIVMNILLLSQGVWRTWTRWAAIGVKAVSVGLAIVILTGPSLIGVTAVALVAAGFPASSETAHTLVDLLNQVVRVALALAILFGGLDMLRQLIRLFRSPGNARTA
jgi:hypothetical protein